jgi:hypothetical protein
LTDEEIEAGWRWLRLGKGPWRKLPPGTKTARDYAEEARARNAEVLREIELSEVDVALLRLRPGDVLVFKTDLMLDKHQVQYLNDRIRENLEHAGLKDADFLFLSHGIDLTVVRKEEE